VALFLNFNLFISKGEMRTLKFKNKATRSKALHVLGAFCITNGESFREIVQELMVVLRDAHHISQWNYNPHALSKSETGYAGITNLGCICYMNSLIQQLFMQKKFRRGILAAPVYKRKGREAENLEDDLLYQLQRMFGILQLTERQTYNPQPWCFAYKGEDHKSPTNYYIQQDAHEFFNLLCDRLESRLKDTPLQHLLNSTLQLTVQGQIKCTGVCKKTRITTETQSFVSLIVKEIKGDIYKALDHYVHSEIISDYKCENCNAAVDQSKRLCLDKLNDTVMLHLTRFEFNYDTFRKEKINDKIQFPASLNLYPYTAEGLDGIHLPDRPPEYYAYTLKGVVIHLGTTDSGHYYSIVKGRENKWYEFNDSFVSFFNLDQLGDDCFGGNKTVQEYNAVHRAYFTKETANNKNAYMLVYERTTPIVVYDSKLDFVSPTDVEILANPVSIKDEDGKVETC
jgi:uncharacterized UBP type Zn finger protein